MSSIYHGMGLKFFVKKLKEGVNNRLEQFYQETLEEYKGDLEALSSRSSKEWMELYNKWSERRIVQKLAESCLLGDHEKETWQN